MRGNRQSSTDRKSGGPALERHRRRLDTVRALAEALPAGEVRTPDIPVSRVVEEGFGMLIGCRAHFQALAEVGLTSGQVERFRELVFALQSAQAVLEG